MRPTTLLLSLVAITGTYASKHESDCRCFPGDVCWPSDDVWASFNTSVGGRLIKTVPLGTVCHDPHYDEEACEALRGVWADTYIHVDSSHSIMAPYPANQSCDPFTPREMQCVVGTYVQYSVNVSSAEDISKTIKFAEEKNIRLVIRNTGHDYLGKSTGAGALAIWTHNIKGASKVDWQSKTKDHDSYNGPAFKFGAGTMGSEAIHFAHQHNMVALTGNCPTVGIAGYMQGGGHSPLSSTHGLAADNVLAFEVVDAQGNILEAVRGGEHDDLFWALAGGGGGTYGVVTSLTVKAFPDTSVMFGTLTLPSAGLSAEAFWEAVALFYGTINPVLVDAACLPYTIIMKDVFMLGQLMCPGLSEEKVNELLRPFVDFLDAQGVQYQKTVTPFETYQDYHDTVLAAMTQDQANLFQGGSWFIPRSLATDPQGLEKVIDAMKNIVDQGAIVAVLGYDVSEKDAYNSVFPSWRDVLMDVVVTVLLEPAYAPEDAYTALETIDRDMISQLRALAPDAGTYMSEALSTTMNWKKDFYGENYERLLAIKNKYDPNHLFYAITAVGSDYWVEQADKRLCMAERNEHDKDEL